LTKFPETRDEFKEVEIIDERFGEVVVSTFQDGLAKFTELRLRLI
jgi:hypothetical protein